jgi:hypothetical protein
MHSNLWVAMQERGPRGAGVSAAGCQPRPEQELQRLSALVGLNRRKPQKFPDGAITRSSFRAGHRAAWKVVFASGTLSECLTLA